MEGAILSKAEVARRLRIGERSLATYGSRYPIYKADYAGVFYVGHVEILEKVRAKILTPDEGWALWDYQKRSMRRRLLADLNAARVCRKAQKGSRGSN